MQPEVNTILNRGCQSRRRAAMANSMNRTKFRRKAIILAAMIGVSLFAVTILSTLHDNPLFELCPDHRINSCSVATFGGYLIFKALLFLATLVITFHSLLRRAGDAGHSGWWWGVFGVLCILGEGKFFLLGGEYMWGEGARLSAPLFNQPYFLIAYFGILIFFSVYELSNIQSSLAAAMLWKVVYFLSACISIFALQQFLISVGFIYGVSMFHDLTLWIVALLFFIGKPFYRIGVPPNLLIVGILIFTLACIEIVVRRSRRLDWLEIDDHLAERPTETPPDNVGGANSFGKRRNP